jgi:hypothetical protein
MDYFIVRSIDSSGYYETRLILMIVAFAVAIYYLTAQRDNRYLTMYLSGVICQGLLELTLKMLGLRGAGYSISVFGWQIPEAVTWLFQGFAEGGILALMGFWLVDIYLNADGRKKLPLYAAICLLIVILAALVGTWSAGQPLTSKRPMFAPVAIILTVIFCTISIALVWLKGNKKGVRYLFLFVVGLTVYSLLTFGTLHLTGARYVAQKVGEDQFVYATIVPQIFLMLWSHFWDIAFAKVHYFAVPFALGLIKPEGD